MNILEIIDNFHMIRILSVFVVCIKILTVLSYLKSYKGKARNRHIATFLYVVPSVILVLLCLITNHFFFMVILLVEKGITSNLAARVLKRGEMVNTEGRGADTPFC